MSSSEGVNFKVYCLSGENNEVKRFFVDANVVTSFVFMKEKLKSVFPHLRDADFKITWKDADGDHISITNDDDFITALTCLSDVNSNNPIVLYVLTDNKNAGSPFEFRVVCDVCQKSISGYRYKCIECPNYDLCANCEGAGHHSEHIMLRLPKSDTPLAKIDRKMMHNAAKALKKSAFNAARCAHRCAKGSFKGHERGGHHEKKFEAEEGTSFQNAPETECPFNMNDLSEVFSQNITPLVEMFARGAANFSEQTGPNPISELARSVANAFSNATQVPTSSQTPSQNGEEKKETSEKPSQASTSQASSQNGDEKKEKSEAESQTAPSAPSAPSMENNNTAQQDMEWTIVVNDSDEAASQASVSSETPKTQPPPPPQDPRLMRGLAQLYEMGFSNENHFLNYMLETHNYNVSEVVKAILQMK